MLALVGERAARWGGSGGEWDEQIAEELCMWRATSKSACGWRGNHGGSSMLSSITLWRNGGYE